MEKTLKVLNELEAAGLITHYALGGAVAALFYVEPVLTYDLDVFVELPASHNKLITLSPLYEYLLKKGYKTQKEHVIIEEIPVQFIPVYNELVADAVKEAVDTKYKRTATRVLRAEYLLALMLQTYRPKDKTRMTQLLEEAEIDRSYLAKILKRHGLMQKWREFEGKFYGK